MNEMRTSTFCAFRGNMPETSLKIRTSPASCLAVRSSFQCRNHILPSYVAKLPVADDRNQPAQAVAGRGSAFLTDDVLRHEPICGIPNIRLRGLWCLCGRCRFLGGVALSCGISTATADCLPRGGDESGCAKESRPPFSKPSTFSELPPFGS